MNITLTTITQEKGQQKYKAQNLPIPTLVLQVV